MKLSYEAKACRSGLRQSIEAAGRFLLLQRRPDGYWESPSIGGPVHAALSVAARTLWERHSAEDEEILRAAVLALATERVSGVHELVKSCVDLVSETISAPAQDGATRRGGIAYAFFARLLRRSFGTGDSRVFGFPWDPTLPDLAIHHWSFALIRRALARPVVDQIPAVGLLLEAAARRTKLV